MKFVFFFFFFQNERISTENKSYLHVMQCKLSAKKIAKEIKIAKFCFVCEMTAGMTLLYIWWWGRKNSSSYIHLIISFIREEKIWIHYLLRRAFFHIISSFYHQQSCHTAIYGRVANKKREPSVVHIWVEMVRKRVKTSKSFFSPFAPPSLGT